MSKPVLYVFELSPPARAVRLVAEYIHLELDIHNLDFMNGEHLEEAYLQINPQHTVPTLVDDGESIWDSHAICAYLVAKYAEDDTLYPQDPLTRARIDQRLHFDSGVLFPTLRNANMVIFSGEKEVPDDKLDAISSAFDMLETFLADAPYLVGDNLTIADICAVATVTTLKLHVPLDPELHAKVVAWIELLSTQLPSYDVLITEATEKFQAFLDAKKAE